MRKSYFAKLVRYMKNVYHIERGSYELSDGRFNPTYSIKMSLVKYFPRNKVAAIDVS